MKRNKIPEIKLYSDGGAEPNPGKGGFGVSCTIKRLNESTVKVTN